MFFYRIVAYQIRPYLLIESSVVDGSAIRAG